MHSRKPARVHQDIARWAGAGVELFATQPTEGWRCLGYDVTGRDIREDLAVVKWEEGYHSQAKEDEDRKICGVHHQIIQRRNYES